MWTETHGVFFIGPPESSVSQIIPGMPKVENFYNVTAQSKLPGGSNGNRSSVPHVLFNNAWTDELNFGIVEYEHC